MFFQFLTCSHVNVPKKSQLNSREKEVKMKTVTKRCDTNTSTLQPIETMQQYEKNISRGECVITKSYRIESYADNNSSREIHFIRVHLSPEIYLVPDFLLSNECDDLISLADSNWSPSQTSIGYVSAPQENYVAGCTPTRTSWSSRLEKGSHDTVTKIEKRISILTGCQWENIEPMVVVRYEPNQYFNEHHDGFFRPFTVLLYLNENFEQGETWFTQLGIKIKPQKGMAVFWRNVCEDGSPDLRLRHAGLPPTIGNKYIVNVFINEKSQIDITNMKLSCTRSTTGDSKNSVPLTRIPTH